MKKIIALLILALTSTTLINAQEWETNFENAKALSAKTDKPIVLVFQGSDWCAPCIKLDREIWSTETFKAYAKEHFIMLQADFPRKKKNALNDVQQKQNNQLAETYNRNGFFPYVAVLDKNGKLLGSTGYKKVSPEAYIKILEAFKS